MSRPTQSRRRQITCVVRILMVTRIHNRRAGLESSSTPQPDPKALAEAERVTAEVLSGIKAEPAS